MNKIKLTKHQVLEEILESPDLITLGDDAGKHDCHYTTYVAKINDRYYQFSLEYSYNNGIQDFEYQDEIEAWEVRPVEVKTIKWETVKDENL